MTNQEIIDFVTPRRGCISISSEMDSFIKSNYSLGTDDGIFFKVCKEGNDAKYGHYMINPKTQHWRNSTFDEFYAGGIVD